MIIIGFSVAAAFIFTMSGVEESSDLNIMMCCASCGIAGVDDIKLKDCSACKLVKYCGVKCQREHRPQHKKECKKRAAELRDEILFRQPESNHLGDCPICCLPLPLDPQKTTFTGCCSKTVCNGCICANMIRELEGKLQPKCPFCRRSVPKSQEERERNMMKRIEASDREAMCEMGTRRCGEGDYSAAFDYWTRAAALGDIHAHFELSILYRDGRVVEKDDKKQLHHLEVAAIGGDVSARNNLGLFEEKTGRTDRAVKHYIIAATLGNDSHWIP